MESEATWETSLEALRAMEDGDEEGVRTALSRFSVEELDRLGMNLIKLQRRVWDVELTKRTAARLGE